MQTENNCCPLVRGLSKVGDAWSMLILRDVATGLARFDQIRVNLNIAPNILTQRLRSLTEAGLLAKRRYNDRPPRDEYVLTDAGRDFLPVLYVIGEWGQRHNGEGAVSRLTDMETGQPVEPVVIDGRTGAPLANRPLKLVAPDDAEIDNHS